ncbi:SH3 domain-containing protein [Clostridium perfringens]|uniref:SH3 domain-containing protein n=1 Tax=Clostridium perfringens TaxID=1502 RepID=UPI00078E82A7|nr:SH3 domain-containing protein [Clostridium perfringens]AMN30888.1 bacteriocin BCN5 [Clostridium perfringens]
MANNIIPNVSSGDLVGSTPTFPPNAVVRGDFLYLRDVDGNQIPGRTVSDGDEITVLFISNEKNIVLVQYPTSSGYRQGYVTNATSIIKYKDDYSWVNGSTPEPVYDFDKTTQIGTLDPRERAVVLYKVDGMTYVAYDTGKGKLTKSGLVHYEGAGSSTGGGSFNGVAPGEVVPGGFTYENNAEVVGDELYLRDANGSLIPGRSVSVGDRITVLDVSYSKQLALVQYPAGSVVRQGYVTNATNLIRYFKQGEWLNGSTTEPVLDENGGSLGSLSPYEAATPLYKKNGMIHVVYDTSKGPNTKSGYVKFEGLAQLPDTSIQIPSVSHSQATVDVYGTSGKGRPLKVYKIGNGSKVLFAGFAIHGWEDRWDNDGLALVNIANSLISKIGDYKAQNGLHGWTVYIAPCMNPDGVIVRGTNNGPGRCAVKSRIDMNRCFPRGFTAQYNSRNYTGPNPLGAQEAVALKEFIEKINRTADELVVIDGHGWLGCTYGDSSIAQYFTKQFGFSHNGPSGGGYFSYWAQGLPRTRGLLLEYPDTYSYGEVISRNYIGKTFNAIINILKNNPNGSDVDTNTDSNYDKWVNKDGKWYYYENGKMVIGWKFVDGEWYYLESNGVMATGWKELGGIWYYLNESGAMVKGWQTILGKTYYFNDSGHMLVGKQVIDGRNYNFNTSGQLDSTNWVKSNNKWYYYENGKMITGWKLINGEWYYLESNGVMATGWKELGGIWYYLNESGAMVKGWQTISGKTYYFNDSGHMLTGKQVIDGKNYEFNGSGQLISDTGDISSSDMTYIAAGEVINVQSFLNVRKGPGTNYDSIGQLHQGDKVSIVAKNGEWYKIKYGSGYGYIHSNFINIVLDEDINKKILKFAGNTGFFENMNLEFEFFNKRIPLGAISFSPLITVEAEISLNMKLDNGSKINLTLTPDELTAEFLGKFNALGVTSSIDKRHLTSVFEKLTLSRNVIDGFRYQVILGPAGTINVTFESTFEYDFGNGNKESIYQRLYFTIHPHLNPNLPSVVRIADIDIETDETVKIEDKNIMQLIHKGIVQFVSYVHYQFSKITIPDIKPITPQQVSIIGSVALGVIIILACVLV